MAEDANSSVDELEALFKRYCLLGQGHGSKKSTLNQTQMNKLFMDSGMYKEFPKLDRNVLGIYWSYAFKKEKEIEYSTAVEGWKNVFADRYNIDSKGEMSKEDFWARFALKLSQCKGPNLNATTKVETVGVMGRLTDESKYTGMHKASRQGASQSAPNKKPMTTTRPAAAVSQSAKPAIKTSSSQHAVTTQNRPPATATSSQSNKAAMTKSTTATITTRKIATSNGTR